MPPVMRNKSAHEAARESEVKALFQEILARIKNDEDPKVLNEFRALVRKNVPFFMRSYFAAYLFKNLVDAPYSRDRGRSDRNNKARDGRQSADLSKGRDRQAPAPERSRPDRSGGVEPRKPVERKQGESQRPERERKAERRPTVVDQEAQREETPRHSLPEGEAATLFISAGRNRRAYAREILALLINEAQVDKDDVGDLRILDNFSFVQVRREVADQVIASLGGKSFRGRPLSVSFAKPRKDSTPEANTGETNGGTDFARNAMGDDSRDNVGNDMDVADAGSDDSPIFSDGADYSHDFGDSHDDDLDSELGAGDDSIAGDDIERNEEDSEQDVAGQDDELSEDKK